MNPNVRRCACRGVPMNPLSVSGQGRKGHDDGCGREKLESCSTFQIDHKNDHNMRDNATHVAKMLVESCKTAAFRAPKITEFETSTA